MTILLAGGTGFVAPHLARLLQRSTTPATPILLTSRSPPQAADDNELAAHFVRFGYLDASTHSNPFTHATAHASPITAVYLTPPAHSDPSPPMSAFVDVAVAHGVRRFVLTTGNSASKGGIHTGGVWGHLDALRQSTTHHGVEYCVLKCTWFAENFAFREHARSIREEGRVYTCAGEAGVPFLAAADIAACAAVLLLADGGREEGGWEWEESYELKGPEVFGHGKAAEILGRVLGREITHRSVSPEELRRRFVDVEGMPEDRAKLMVWLYEQTAAGGEAKMNDHVEMITGRKPVSLEHWATVNREAFV